MRRPPFTARPLALSVTLVLSSPVVMAADIAASSVVGTNPATTYSSNVVLTSADNGISVIDTTANSVVDAVVSGVVSADANETKLIKTGAGTVSLTNNNTYKGGTEIQDGTLSIARAASLGSGDVVIDASTNQNVTLETQSSTTLTQNINLLGDDATIKTGGTNAGGNITQITGTVSGTGQLIKDGAGTLSLTNNNTYKGGTDVQDGTVSIARAASLGSGAVTLNQNTVLETLASTTLTQNIDLLG
jgi:fibronectin-binding autotransporter adhesin